MCRGFFSAQEPSVLTFKGSSLKLWRKDVEKIISDSVFTETTAISVAIVRKKISRNTVSSTLKIYFEFESIDDSIKLKRHNRWIKMIHTKFRQASDHYGETYFEQQSKAGTIGVRMNAPLFRKYIKKDGCVLDFGCGGGFLLQELDVAQPLGVDVNAVAHKSAGEKGIEVFERLDQIPDGIVDTIVSNHALEHTENPLI